MLISEVIVIPSSGKLKGSDNLRVCGYNGRPVIFRGDEFPSGSLVFHVPVDTFCYAANWLEDPLVRVRYFFGKPSYGFFLPAPSHCRIGDLVEWSGKLYERPTFFADAISPSLGILAQAINRVWSHFRVLPS